MDRRDITPLVLTYNEEPNIARCLNALSWAQRVVVVDSHSTDATAAVAEGFPNVAFFTREMDSMATQWNFGLSKCDTPWVLSLDADYVVPDAFLDEVEAMDDLPLWGWAARFEMCVLRGRPLRAHLYPPRVVLHPRDATYVQDGHTQRLVVEGPVQELATPFQHDDRKPLRRWVTNQIGYAQLEAEKLLSSTPTNLKERIRGIPGLACIAAPLYSLLFKGGLRDGWAGAYYALQRAAAEAIISLRLIELRSQQDGRGRSITTESHKSVEQPASYRSQRAPKA